MWDAQIQSSHSTDFPTSMMLRDSERSSCYSSWGDWTQFKLQNCILFMGWWTSSCNNSFASKIIKWHVGPHTVNGFYGTTIFNTASMIMNPWISQANCKKCSISIPIRDFEVQPYCLPCFLVAFSAVEWTHMKSVVKIIIAWSHNSISLVVHHVFADKIIISILLAGEYVSLSPSNT